MRKLLSILAIASVFVTFGAMSARAGDYGKCNFDSDCHKGCKCNGGTCSDAPGGKCNFDSECNGKKCSGGTCK